MGRVYSFSAISGVITNKSYGQISFGGGGNLMETIGYAFDATMFQKSATADGGVAFSHSNDRSGSVSLSILQTSPLLVDLLQFLKWCWVNPALAESDISVIDPNGNVAFSAENCYPEKIPDNGGGSTAVGRAIKFICKKITPNEA